MESVDGCGYVSEPTHVERSSRTSSSEACAKKEESNVEGTWGISGEDDDDDDAEAEDGPIAGGGGGGG